MSGLQTYEKRGIAALSGILIFIFSITLQAQELPDIPDLARVTVDHSDNGVLVQWEASEDMDVEFYTIYKQRDQVFEFVATVPGSIKEFKHMSGGSENLYYAVTAIDSAGNESLFEQNVHRAVTATVEFDPCIPSNTIDWNAYFGWEGNISGYRIYGGSQGNPLQIIGFVSPTTHSFVDKGISTDSIYNYYVETVNTNGLTSLSAIESVSSLYPEAPQFLTIDYVSVIDRSGIELQFSADVSGPVNDFRVMKRSNQDTPFIEVETITNASQSTLVIQDQFLTSATSYEYLVQSIFYPGSCTSPIVISESNSGTNILLQQTLEGQIVTLNWTPYQSYDSGLMGYTIQRRSGNGEFFDIQTVSPTTTSWRESVQSVINGLQPGELQYKVIAIENQSGNDPGISISNIVSVTVETRLLIPNAFTPGSNDMNFEFKPFFDFSPKKYIMIVLDRGGRKLFETTDPGQGWDGRFQSGEYVNEGVYVYYIQYTDHTGISKSLTGNVTALYP